jgi:hypothetical protein
MAKTKEVSLVQFCAMEAAREGKTTRTIRRRIKSGYYPNLKYRHINRRVVMVQNEA